MVARVPLLAPQDVTEEHRSFVEAMEECGGYINLYRAMAHSPRAFRAFYELLLVLWHGALSDRQREIAILTVVSKSDADYPLGWHLIDGAEAGLKEAEMRAIVRGDATALPREDAAIAAFARELTTGARVSEGTFDTVRAFLNERQIVELTMIVGLYRFVAGMANALCIELDDDAARAPGRFRAERP
jgi:alkylhydroperoxidase family enzyme